VVTFPSFGSEGHGVQPPAEGLQIFLHLFFCPESYFCFVLKRFNNEIKKTLKLMEGLSFFYNTFFPMQD